MTIKEIDTLLWHAQQDLDDASSVVDPGEEETIAYESTLAELSEARKTIDAIAPEHGDFDLASLPAISKAKLERLLTDEQAALEEYRRNGGTDTAYYDGKIAALQSACAL